MEHINLPSELHLVESFVDKIKDDIELYELKYKVIPDLNLVFIITKLKKYLLPRIINSKPIGRFFYYEGLTGALIAYIINFEGEKDLAFTSYFDLHNPEDANAIYWISRTYKRLNLVIISDMNEYLTTLEVEYRQQEELKFFHERANIYNNQVDVLDFPRLVEDFTNEFSIVELFALEQ